MSRGAGLAAEAGEKGVPGTLELYWAELREFEFTLIDVMGLAVRTGQNAPRIAELSAICAAERAERSRKVPEEAARRRLIAERPDPETISRNMER